MALLAPHNAARGFLTLAVLVVVGLTIAPAAQAQEQDRKLLDRILHPNMDLHYDGLDRGFDTKSASRAKTASTKSFVAGTATPWARDGAYHAKTFSDGRGTFNTGKFGTKPASELNRPLADGGRSYSESGRSIPVQADRSQNKALPNGTRGYVDNGKPYLVPGKRQDSIDEMRQQKNLTSDQVREILNKNQ